MFTPVVRHIAKPRLFAVAKPLYFVRYSSSSASKGTNGTKKVLIGTAVLLAGAGGALAYGCHNSDFRHSVEETMPWTKCCFEFAERLLCKPKSKCPKRSVIADVNKEDLDSNFVAKKNKELEAALVTAIEIAENKVRAAKDSKLKTIALTREHAALLKKAVDDGQNGDWSGVANALEKADKFTVSDRKDEIEARNSLDALKQIAFDGKNCPYTSDHKLIVLAMETAKKLSNQIDELNLLAETARIRSRFMTQYRVLVEESRKRFADQLHKLSPHIDVQDDKMSIDEAKAVIARARAEVDSLYRQLIEQQLEAEQKIANAVEAHRLASSKLAKQELEAEQTRIRRSDANRHPEIVASRETWESELKERLARASAAHEEHMQQVLLMQKQINDAEMAAKIEEAIHTERRRHARQVGRLQSKVDGMEIALTNRRNMDSLNRRTKYCWLACQNLVNSVVNGRCEEDEIELKRFPLAIQLAIIKEVSGDDRFIKVLISALSNESIYEGTYSEADLKRRFSKVEKVARTIAYVDENNAGPFTYGLSYARSKLRMNIPKKISSKDKVDPRRMSTNEVLDRAKYFLEKNDLNSAVRVLQLLRGEAARVARDWIHDTRIHLETRMVAEALVAHSTINGIRTTY